MNSASIIGNLTKDPDSRITSNGINVCSFTVAVNRRRTEGTDYFRVTTWRALADICTKYLGKGKKVYVRGPVSVSTYHGQDGQTRATMEINAEEVEFLFPKEKEEEHKNTGFVEVNSDDIPF
jgi:single-strand DNA-binding protein